MESVKRDSRTATALPRDRRFMIAVVAEQEEDRTLLSKAFAPYPRHRIACSASLETADEIIKRNDVDAIVGFIDMPDDWSRFRALAETFPDALSVLLVSDPDRIEGVADGHVLNAVVAISREDLPGRAADVTAETARTFNVASTPIARADELDQRKLESLTTREREVLTLTAEGLAMSEIARRIHRAYGTVASHRARIMKKLGLHDKVALTRFAIRTGLIQA